MCTNLLFLYQICNIFWIENDRPSEEEIWNILPSPKLQPWINCAQGQTNWNVMLPSCSKIFL